LAEKDQLEALKKLNARARSAASGPHSTLPTPEAPLHASAAADLQGNVGNAGLRQMMESEAGQKAHKAGATGGAKTPTTHDPQKHAAHLENEATQHKSAAARERKVAQNKRTTKAPQSEPVDPAKRTPKTAAKRTPKTAAKLKAKAPSSQPEHSEGHHEEQAAARRGKPSRAAKDVHPPTSKVHHEADAAQKKASASEARAEASRSKAQVSRQAPGQDSKHVVPGAGKSAFKSAEHKEKKALKAETDAELAERNALAKKKSAKEEAAAKTPVKSERAKTEPADNEPKTAKSKAKPASVEKKTDAKASAARANTAARAQEADLAEQKRHKTEHEKQKAEAKSAAKSEANVDATTKATAAKEAEVSARAHEAATAVASTKADAEANALEDEKSPTNDTADEVSRASDLPGADGTRVTLIGTYVPRPAPGGSQMLGHVSILVGNIEVRLGSDTRATAELLRLSGERVAVTGTLDLKRASTEQATDPRKAEKPVLTRPGTVSKR